MPEMNLTSLFVERLKPTGAQVEYFDTSSDGLSLRVNQNGTRSWRFSYTLNGKLKRRTLGRYQSPERGLAWARAERDKAQGKVADGVDPFAGDAAENADDRFAFDACLERFIAQHVRALNRAPKEGERILRKEFATVWGARDIRTIQRSDVLAVLQGIVDRGSPVSARAALTRVRKFFNWYDDNANEADRLPVNPCYRLKPLAKETSRERVLTNKELAAVWQAGGEAGYPHGTLMQLLTLLSQRRTEVASMRWQDLNFDEKTWSLIAKGGKVHLMPLPKLVLKIIKACQREDGAIYVFPSRDNPEKYLTGYSKMKAKIDTFSGVMGWVPHDLRRTMASKAPALGISEVVIEMVQNHRLPTGNLSATQRVYNRHKYLDEMRAALDKWAAFVVKQKA